MRVGKVMGFCRKTKGHVMVLRPYWWVHHKLLSVRVSSVLNLGDIVPLGRRFRDVPYVKHFLQRRVGVRCLFLFAFQHPPASLVAFVCPLVVGKKNGVLCHMDFILQVIVPWVFGLILSGHSINPCGRNMTHVLHSSGSPAITLYNKDLIHVYWIELHHGDSRIWWTNLGP